jgi:capsid protein
MLAASAVDKMLNLKGYTDGGLHARIVKAAGDHVITQEMATDQRHAEEATSLPTPENARRVIDFAMALAELLFVLPGRVQRGISQAHEDG